MELEPNFCRRSPRTVSARAARRHFLPRRSVDSNFSQLDRLILSFPSAGLAGRPNPAAFPFKSLTLHLNPPLGSSNTEETSVEIEGADMVEALS